MKKKWSIIGNEKLEMLIDFGHAVRRSTHIYFHL